MYGKRGQSMSLTTIILIVLGLAVLVFLIFGFSTGWGNLWGTITELGGGDANVDDISRGCALACQQGASYGFCDQKRDLIISKGKETSGSCFDFAKKRPSLGIENCNNLCSGDSDGCVSKEKKDVNCDGVGEEGSPTKTTPSSSVGSGAIAIDLSQESLDISYVVITSDEDSFSESGEVFA